MLFFLLFVFWVCFHSYINHSVLQEGDEAGGEDFGEGIRCVIWGIFLEINKGSKKI